MTVWHPEPLININCLEQYSLGPLSVVLSIIMFWISFNILARAIRVSDNDGAFDQHLGVGQGTIDWMGFSEVVKGMNYGNIVMLESTEHVQESLQTLRSLFPFASY